MNHVLFEDFEEMGLSDRIGPFCRYQGVDVGMSSKLVVIPKNDEDMAVRKPTFLKFDNIDVGVGCSQDPLIGDVMYQSVKFELENS